MSHTFVRRSVRVVWCCGDCQAQAKAAAREAEEARSLLEKLRETLLDYGFGLEWVKRALARTSSRFASAFRSLRTHIMLLLVHKREQHDASSLEGCILPTLPSIGEVTKRFAVLD
jgi:hypothetical protein